MSLKVIVVYGIVFKDLCFEFGNVVKFFEIEI